MFLKQATVLWLSGLIGQIAALPYVLELGADQLAAAADTSGISQFMLVAISTLQTAILLAIAVPLGLWASGKLNLRAPLSEAFSKQQPIGHAFQSFAPLSLAVGGLAGGVIVALDVIVFQPLLPQLATESLPQPAIWKGVLASLYGGITEELLCRLFLLSLFGWLLTRITRTTGRFPCWAFWTANVAVAILFGMGHLPAAAGMLPLSPLWVIRVLILNSAFSLVAGWLFRKRGLESAMLAHWMADMVLHGVTPLMSSLARSVA